MTKTEKREPGYENPRHWRLNAVRKMKNKRHFAVWSALVHSTESHGPFVQETWEQIADLSACQPQWVKTVVRELIRDGLVQPIGDRTGGRGRANRLRLRPPDQPIKGCLQNSKGVPVDSQRGAYRPPTGITGITGIEGDPSGADSSNLSGPEGAGSASSMDQYLEEVAARAVANAVRQGRGPRSANEAGTGAALRASGRAENKSGGVS